MSVIQQAPLGGATVYLERPRINNLLAEAVRSGTLVSVRAGAGYGKTSAVSAFLRKQDVDTLWLQLTERDNAGGRFWENLVRATASYNMRMAERLRQLDFPETNADFRRYRRVVLEERLEDDQLVAVFDDCHLIHNPAILRFFERSTRSPLPNFSIILIARMDTDAEKQKLPSGVPVVSVTMDDLRFTRDEVAEYFKMLGLSVPMDALASIHAKTHGWALALVLLGLALQKNPSLDGYVWTAMKSNIFKLLDSEIFHAASKRLQRFLVRLSLIDHLATDLVWTLAGDAGLVGEMERIGFGVHCDDRLGAYMLHPLFREYLCRKQAELPEEDVRDTYRQAAAWCSGRGSKIDAIYYYEKTGEYSPIVQIMCDSTVQPPAAMSKLVMPMFDNAPPAAKLSDARFAAIHLCLKLSLRQLDKAFELGCRYRDEFEAMPETPFTTRALAGVYSALGYTRYLSAPFTDVYDFDVYYIKQDEYYSRNPYPVSGAMTHAVVGPWISMVATDRPGAMDEYIDALSRTVSHTVHAMGGNVSGMDALARGELCFYRNELGAAEAFIDEALEASMRHRQHDLRNRALLYLLRIGFARGEPAKAERAMKELERQLDAPEYALRNITFDIVAGTYYLMLGQPQSVAEWLKTDLDESALTGFVANFSKLVRARHQLVSGDFQKLLAFIRNRRWPGMVLFGRLEWLVLEAVCRERIGDGAGALEALRQGYGLALSNRITMPFIEMGDAMRALVEAAMGDGACGVPRAWLQGVHDAAAAYAANQRRFVEKYKEAHHVEERIVLTQCEKDVLEDLAFDLSRAEISAIRNLSMHAVRNTVNSLFAKFETGDVAEVLRIAVEKGILPR
ncbi:MAG: hypothetical protein LBT74_04035 [Acidobacteriota bacterium]|jgi:LuxR family maltose regulon positive regulatory protein|nr:hypothetical protein [Acidobacteriota bacterium]